MRKRIIILSVAALVTSSFLSLATSRYASRDSVTQCIAVEECEGPNAQLMGTKTTTYWGFPAAYRINVEFQPDNQSRYASVGMEAQPTSKLLAATNIIFWMSLFFTAYKAFGFLRIKNNAKK